MYLRAFKKIYYKIIVLWKHWQGWDISVCF